MCVGSWPGSYRSDSQVISVRCIGFGWHRITGKWVIWPSGLGHACWIMACIGQIVRCVGFVWQVDMVHGLGVVGWVGYANMSCVGSRLKRDESKWYVLEKLDSQPMKNNSG